MYEREIAFLTNQQTETRRTLEAHNAQMQSKRKHINKMKQKMNTWAEKEKEIQAVLADLQSLGLSEQARQQEAGKAQVRRKVCSCVLQCSDVLTFV